MFNPTFEGKEYSTDLEYLQQQVNYLWNVHSTTLEDVKKIKAMIKELEVDLKVIKTPELKVIVENMIAKNKGIITQGNEVVKRSRKDLGFLNSIYKKVKE